MALLFIAQLRFQELELTIKANVFRISAGGRGRSVIVVDRAIP